MEIIIHKIRLFDVGQASAFESWVQNTDYAACINLPSIVRFDVHQVAVAPSAPYHYIEVIKITSRAEFKADMQTPIFAGLEQKFSRMATVTEEIAGTQLGAGYVAS
jgi:hypothetical protein